MAAVNPFEEKKDKTTKRRVLEGTGEEAEDARGDLEEAQGELP